MAEIKITDIPAAQDMAYCMGSEGCLFLCYCAIAERVAGVEIDVVRAAKRAIDAGLLEYYAPAPRRNLASSFYVKDAEKLLLLLTGRRCEVTRVKDLPKDFHGEYVIKYSWKNYTHFVLSDYDPMTDSNTKKLGKITGYYLVKEL